MRNIAFSLVMLLLLTSCGGSAKEYDPEATASAVLESTTFSETLEPLDSDLIIGLYGLDPAPESMVAYTSTGATAEELVVLHYANQAGSDAGLEALKKRVADQTVACDGYLPAELPKLEKAILSQVGNTVLLLVANDYVAADAALKTVS